MQLRRPGRGGQLPAGCAPRLRRRALALGSLVLLAGAGVTDEAVLFEDDFEHGLSDRWVLSDARAISVVDSGDAQHRRVMELSPAGLVYALVRDSAAWGPVRVEGEVLFPTDGDAYLGLVYAFDGSQGRTDFGSIYLKGDGSYLRVNPWRDGNASRLLYEEYKTDLVDADAVRPREWVHFAAEVVDGACHFYVHDMRTPKLTFALYEGRAGLLGFKPRVAGYPVWIDNIRIAAIDGFGYTGPPIPALRYDSARLMTDWQVLGPLSRPSLAVERSGAGDVAVDGQRWRPFAVDARGAVITGRVTEYLGDRPVAYFRTELTAPQAGEATLHFSSVDELAVFVNGMFQTFVYRQGYVSGAGLRWNAWYDFADNPEHAGRRIRVPVVEGMNRLVVRVRNGDFASGGFFARVESID